MTLKFLIKVNKDSFSDLPFVDTVTDQFITNSLSESLIDYVSLVKYKSSKRYF